MKFRDDEVKTFVRHLLCEITGCGGEMLPTGICLTSYPAQYPHQCDTCGYTLNVRGKTYPTQVLETVEDEEPGPKKKACLEVGCEGDLKPTGISIDTFPPILPHKCVDCGTVRNIVGEG